MTAHDRAADILAELGKLRAADLPVHGGRTLAYVYDSGLGPETEALAERAYAAMAGVNGLDMTAFPSVAALENDVVGAAARLLGGGPDTVGTFTSGGTESCLMAVLTAREHARATRGVTAPQLVLPVTAHAAFRKAAHLFGLEVVDVPVDPATFTPDPAAMAAAVTERTALVVVSAPSYPHGVLDPVAAVAAHAAARGVLCHVDACIGGWFLGHLRRDPAYPVPQFDLGVPGVTSLSVDLHKYAYTPKGASVVLFRDAELRRHGYFASASWPGYPVVNATLQGTKSAGPLAAAWAVLRHIGDDGYADLARRTMATVAELRDGIAAIPGLRVLGEPVGALLAIESTAPEDVDVFVVADCLRAHGWYIQPQPGTGGLPRTVHLTVTAAAHGKAAGLLQAIAAAVDEARTLGPAVADPGLVEAAALIDPAALTAAESAALLELAGLGGGGAMPERMAPVLALLEKLPAALAERLLPDVIGGLFRPTPGHGTG